VLAVVVSTVKELAATKANIKVAVALATSHCHFTLRFWFLSACAFCLMIRVPSLHVSLFGSTPISGVPSIRQNAN
jgi:hypothetical protein